MRETQRVCLLNIFHCRCRCSAMENCKIILPRQKSNYSNCQFQLKRKTYLSYFSLLSAPLPVCRCVAYICISEGECFDNFSIKALFSRCSESEFHPREIHQSAARQQDIKTNNSSLSLPSCCCVKYQILINTINKISNSISLSFIMN